MQELLTAEEVRTMLRASRATIAAMLKEGKLPGAFRIGTTDRGHWRIPRSAHPALKAPKS